MSTPETLDRELAALDDALAGRPVDPDLADLAELAVLVRDERSTPDPAFASSLDERARAGFPRPAKKRRMPAFSWPKITLPALGLAASVFLVVVIATSIPSGGGDDSAGGSGGGGSASTALPETSDSGSSADSSGGGSSSARARKQAPGAAGDESASSPAIGTLPPEPPQPGNPGTDTRTRRYVERSAQLTIATRPRDIDRAAAKIIKVADDLGGFVVTSQVSSGASGEFELRVPERRLQTALSRLSDVGKVRDRTQASQDITGAVASVADRLRDARTERRSLLRQLAKATTVNQTESIRRRLRLVSGEIARAKAELRNVKRRASFSTIAVQLVADRALAEGDSDDDSSWTPGDAWRDAGRILEVSAGVLMIAAALALPVGLVLLLAWLAMRQAAQRRRERALDAV